MRVNLYMRRQYTRNTSDCLHIFQRNTKGKRWMIAGTFSHIALKECNLLSLLFHDFLMAESTLNFSSEISLQSMNTSDNISVLTAVGS